MTANSALEGLLILNKNFVKLSRIYPGQNFEEQISMIPADRVRAEFAVKNSY